MKNLLYIVMYDIENNSLRTKAAKKLQQYGYERIQYSIFCGLENPRSLPALWNELQLLIKPAEDPNDRLFVLQLKKSYFRAMKILGSANLNMAYLLGEQHTLII